MLIEMIDNKEPESLEIGRRYKVKAGTKFLSSNRIIQITSINERYRATDVGYIYIDPIDVLRGSFTRSIEQIKEETFPEAL